MEAPFRCAESLVEVIADQLRPRNNSPFAFYGHSMGALLSFELARALAGCQAPQPLGLFVSGRRAPTAEAPPAMFSLSTREFIAELRKLNGTAEELLDDAEAREHFLPLLRADFELVDTYCYFDQKPLSCPIRVYGGLQDRFVPVNSLYAWGRQTTSDCIIRLLPGDHFSHIRGEEFFKVLTQDVLACCRSLRV
jgi:surfactin synthase thioesterase subunit